MTQLKALTVAAGLLLSTPPYFAHAAESFSNEVEVCPGNYVRVVDADGAPLSPDVVAGMTRVVLSDCSDKPIFGIRTVGNVLANIHYNATNGVLYINGVANSLIRGNYQLACVYALEPIRTGATHWIDCGTLTKYGVSSIVTPTTIFCPAPSTRWHAKTSLFSISGKELLRDDKWVVVP